jgi:ribosome-binding protein aMBF1 (putative translation factor)
VEVKICEWCGAAFESRAKTHRFCSRQCSASARLKQREADPEWADKARRNARKASLLRNFGITVEQYDELLDAQDGVCAICGKEPQGQRLAVEHDHGTGEILGLCCFYCNHWLLGRHGRDPEKYQRAADYLRDPPARRVLPPGHVAPEGKRKKRKRKKPVAASSDQPELFLS